MYQEIIDCKTEICIIMNEMRKLLESCSLNDSPPHSLERITMNSKKKIVLEQDSHSKKKTFVKT